MNLTEELAKTRQHIRTSVFAPEQVVSIDQEVEKVKDSGLVESSLQIGDIAPNFTLPNRNGDLYVLAELLKSGPVVLSFYRGNWCPYCSLELRALEEILPAIHSLDASLVSISPQTRRSTRLTVEQQNLTHPVLYDQGNQVARQFGIVYQVTPLVQQIFQEFGVSLRKSNGDQTNELPVPATFIIDRNGKIVHRLVDPDYTNRLDPVEIITVLSKLKKAIA